MLQHEANGFHGRIRLIYCQYWRTRFCSNRGRGEIFWCLQVVWGGLILMPRFFPISFSSREFRFGFCGMCLCGDWVEVSFPPRFDSICGERNVVICDGVRSRGESVRCPPGMLFW